MVVKRDAEGPGNDGYTRNSTELLSAAATAADGWRGSGRGWDQPEIKHPSCFDVTRRCSGGRDVAGSVAVSSRRIQT